MAHDVGTLIMVLYEVCWQNVGVTAKNSARRLQETSVDDKSSSSPSLQVFCELPTHAVECLASHHLYANGSNEAPKPPNALLMLVYVIVQTGLVRWSTLVRLFSDG
jgi:hypothetical protein